MRAFFLKGIASFRDGRQAPGVVLIEVFFNYSSEYKQIEPNKQNGKASDEFLQPVTKHSTVRIRRFTIIRSKPKANGYNAS